MEDEKKLNKSTKEEIVLEKKSAEKNYSDNQLNDELEKLAQTFREELKKAQELSDEEFIEAYADDLGIIPEEELCECCGERRKDKSRGEGYQYCTVCRENMKIYPIGIPNVLVAVAIVILSVLSVMLFCTDFYGYDLMYEAQKAEKENKLDSAIAYYDTAIQEFAEGGITPRKAYLNSAEIIYKTMDSGSNSMYEVAEMVDIALSDFGKKLPLFANSVEMQTESLVLYGTMQEFYNIISDEKYTEYSSENTEMYEEIMTQVEALVGKEISVASVDGETTQMLTTNEGMVRFCQYMFAYISANYDDSYKYMVMTSELEPDFLWLYAYELGMAELQSGNTSRAKELAADIIGLNVEDADGYSLYTSAERVSGNYQKALRWANKGLEYVPKNAELMRMKAMALCCSGDYEQAKQVVDNALELQEYAVLYFTAMVVENELGNIEAVEDFKEKLAEQEIEISDKMNDYLSGKITAVQLFTEGTGEVE